MQPAVISVGVPQPPAHLCASLVKQEKGRPRGEAGRPVTPCLQLLESPLPGRLAAAAAHHVEPVPALHGQRLEQVRTHRPVHVLGGQPIDLGEQGGGQHVGVAHLAQRTGDSAQVVIEQGGHGRHRVDQEQRGAHPPQRGAHAVDGLDAQQPVELFPRLGRAALVGCGVGGDE